MFEAVMGNEQPLVGQVSDQIVRMITDRNLSAGEKLPNEFELAEMLHVGRGTVREAVKLLVSRNILEIRRGKGTFVSKEPGLVEDPLGLAFFQDKHKLALDLLEIRLIMEPEIAALAAQNATGKEVRELRQLCVEIGRLAEQSQDYTQQDVDFHRCLARSTRNQVMPHMIPMITSGIELFNTFPYEVERNEALLVHRDITEAVVHKEPERAREAMSRHLSYNVRNLQLFKNRL